MASGIGEELRAARMAQGRSIEEVAAAVRARVDQLRAIEDERFDVFPGHVYARGFLRNYATALGLDAEPFVARYREHHQGRDEVEDTVLTTIARPTESARRLPPSFGWAAAVVLVAGGVVWLGLGSGGRAPQAVLPDDVIAAPAEEPADDAAPSDAPAQVEVDEPAEPVYDGVRIVLSFEQQCWMSVEVDGVAVASGLTPAGQTLEYRGQSEIVVKYGNAGGVFQQVNGEDLGMPGAGGQVVTMRYTLQGAERL